MRATVKIRRGALITAAAMACAAVGTPTPGVGLVDLITGALPGARAESAYPFNPWALPVHPPVPGDLPLPPMPPSEPDPTQPTDETFPTPPGPGGIGPGAGTLGIPANVLDAYRRAADLMAARDPSCHLTWPVLAGIGRIESNHAYGGNLRADGTTVTRIVGIPLDGRPGVATIGDSENGALDGDTVWDRAVGPMQFLPGTWEVFGQDGNDDGRRDPHNMYDAALAAAVYLCQGDRDLRVESNLRAALFAYNPSTSYVNAVLAWIRAYERGGVPVEPTPTTPGPSNPIGVSSGTSSPPTPKPTTSPSPKPPADQVAPEPPTGLRVVAFTGTSVTLAWTSATDDVGVATYDVYADDRLVGATTRTSLNVAGLTPDTSYTFTVRARDAAGNRSQPSQPVTVVTDVTPPVQVGDVQVTASSAKSVSLQWDPVSDNLPGEVTYRIYRSDQRNPIAETTATTYTDGTVAADTTYKYTIVAVDSNGNLSEPTFVTVDREPPTVPTNVTVEISGESATLSWTASTDDVGVDRYEIEVGSDTESIVARLEVQCGQAEGDSTASACSASIAGLDAMTPYTFVVHAVDAAGNRSAPATVTKETLQTSEPSPTEPSPTETSPTETSPTETSPTETSTTLSQSPSGKPTSGPSDTTGENSPSGASTSTTTELSPLVDESTSPPGGDEGGTSPGTETSMPPAREESTPPTTTSAPEEPEPDDDPESSDEPSSSDAPATSDAPSPTSEPSPTEAPSDEPTSSDPSPEEEGETTSATSAALVLKALSDGESVIAVESADQMRKAYCGLIEGGTIVSGPALRERMEWKNVDAAELWQSSETVWVARTDDVLVGLHPGATPAIELQLGGQTLTVEFTS